MIFFGFFRQMNFLVAQKPHVGSCARVSLHMCGLVHVRMRVRVGLCLRVGLCVFGSLCVFTTIDDKNCS